MAAPRILLINPWIYDFAAFDFWAKPLGLLYIGESLRRMGIEVFLIDCVGWGKGTKYGIGRFHKQEITKPKVLQDIPRRYCRYGIPEEVFLQQLKGIPRPDLVLVTATMTYWYPGAFRVIELVRGQLRGIPIILGGIYATLCYDHATKFSGADHIYHGRVSNDFFRLIAEHIDLEIQDPGNPVMDYRPAIDLMINPQYGILATSEGCPLHCSYCASHILTPRFRQKHLEDCFREIVWMNRSLGLKDIAFYDDALLTSAKSHFIPLMEKISKDNLEVRFHVPNGILIRDLDTEVALLLKRSGFQTIRLGLETTTSGRERTIDGKASYEDLKNAISLLRSAGYESNEIGVYLLSGLPGQSREEVEESMWKVKAAGARPYLSEFSPVPGTGLWKAAKMASPYPIEEEPLFQNPSLSPCAPEGFTIERFHWRKSIINRKL